MALASSSLWKRFDQAFVLDDWAVRQICGILRTRIGSEIEIKAVLQDGTTRGFADEGDLLKFSNPKERRIVELSVRAYADRDKNMSVVADRGNSIAGLRINGEAEDDLLVVIRHELAEIIHGIRPMWSLVATNDFAITLVLAFTVGATMVSTVFAYGTRISTLAKTWPDSAKGAVAVGFLIVLMVAIFCVSGLIRACLRYLFPIGVFLIGSEMKDEIVRRRVRGVLGGSILLAFVISLAASIAANYVFR